MNLEARKLPSWFAACIILWPAVLWLLGVIAAQIVLLNGCTLTARGPEECLMLGFDVGEWVYPLWALGFFLVYVLIWIPIGLLLVGIIRLFLK